MPQHIAAMMEIVERLRGIGETIKDNYIACMLSYDIRDITVKEVLLVPKLGESLLSAYKLASTGHKLIFEGNICNIFKGHRLTATVEVDGWLCKVKCKRSANALSTTILRALMT